MTEEEKRERHRVLARARYAKNPEPVKARVLRYAKKYPEKIKAANKKYAALHKPRTRNEETKKAWYFKNHEKHLRKCRGYYAANKEKVLKRAQHRRLTKVFAGVVDVEKKELLIVTKLLQLNVKKLLEHGETNEEHR